MNLPAGKRRQEGGIAGTEVRVSGTGVSGGIGRRLEVDPGPPRDPGGKIMMPMRVDGTEVRGGRDRRVEAGPDRLEGKEGMIRPVIVEFQMQMSTRSPSKTSQHQEGTIAIVSPLRLLRFRITESPCPRGQPG